MIILCALIFQALYNTEAGVNSTTQKLFGYWGLDRPDIPVSERPVKLKNTSPLNSPVDQTRNFIIDDEPLNGKENAKQSEVSKWNLNDIYGMVLMNEKILQEESDLKLMKLIKLFLKKLGKTYDEFMKKVEYENRSKVIVGTLSVLSIFCCVFALVVIKYKKKEKTPKYSQETSDTVIQVQSNSVESSYLQKHANPDFMGDTEVLNQPTKTSLCPKAFPERFPSTEIS